MKWFTEVVGILLCVQGAGGALSALLDGGRGWYLVRYVVPGGAQFAVGVGVALVGVLVLAARSRGRQDA